jgi:mannose/cellobiose epimerase-like protein (N-acyl-D-glucosamine 2-epimerase family)
MSLPEEAGSALRRHVLEPLLAHCVDREYGGFLVDLDDRWRPAGPHEKSLEHATRTTLAFAVLAQLQPGEGCEAMVRHGCAFLQAAMWDPQHGGFFARVDRSGRPLWNGLKHPHAVTYAARAFLMAVRHLPTGEGRGWADRALSWLNQVAWDERHGGYWGVFRRDNQRYPPGARLPTPDGLDIFGLPPGVKELNTLADAIEMLTAFVEAGMSREAGRLAALVSLVIDRLVDPDGVAHYLYREDWRPLPDLVRVGYTFQLARHLTRVPADPARHAELVSRARQLVDFALAAARHPAGGFCLAVAAGGRTWPATGPSSDLRQWWVQVEAIRTLHALPHHAVVAPAARARYSAERDAQWRFLRRAFFDERHRGLREVPIEGPRSTRLATRWGWLSGRRARAPLKSHAWKDTSHEAELFAALVTDPGSRHATA